MFFWMVALVCGLRNYLMSRFFRERERESLLSLLGDEDVVAVAYCKIHKESQLINCSQVYSNTIDDSALLC